MLYKIAKTILPALFFLFVSLAPGKSQFTRIGGGLSFSSGIETAEHKTGNPAFTARGVLEIGERLWLVPGVSFYMPGKRQNSTTIFGAIDADFTFRLATERTILFYALAGPGVSFLRTSYDIGESYSKTVPALDIGTGIEMIVEKDLNAFAQIKGVIGSYKQYVVISLGVHYYISGRRYRTW